jgi:hypothetical protein
MRFSSRSMLSIVFSLFAIAAVVGGYAVMNGFSVHAPRAHAAHPADASKHINCATSALCTEVHDSEEVFGEGTYVGHDEPSLLFYSKTSGSGNQNRWQMTLPKDPSPSLAGTPGVGYNFQLHPAFWFGMAMCDTQSYPEQSTSCTPDSDTNIVDPAVSAAHPGEAFMEMQFYPPGWVPFQLPAGISCDPTKWCAALNIDSLSENPITGQFNNSACLNAAGLEYVNFAFITLSGVSQAPASPLLATGATFTPDSTKDLFMNSGDKLVVTEHDTPNGFQVVIQDKTTHQTGSMTASIANGFGQVLFDPTATTCTNIPYDFHPMYSTSSEMTRVTWAAHSYNVAFSDEIGHWDYCNGTNPITPGGNCPSGNTEGLGSNTEPSDPGVDDIDCQPASNSTLVALSGCYNPAGLPAYDGTSYITDWPDGNTTLHPTSVLFTSPLTGSGYSVKYSRAAFETDLPRIETNTCNRNTGVGCTLFPTTDDGNAAAFYPFYSTNKIGGHCVWQLGNHIPGSTNDFGQNSQYGTLLSLSYTAFGSATGATITRYNDFRQVLSKNPC